jgi:hypothetical protein
VINGDVAWSSSEIWQSYSPITIARIIHHRTPKEPVSGTGYRMSPAKPAKIFISATFGDLGSVRGLVKDALLKIGCMPVEQADFPPDYRKVAEFLAS